MTDGYAKEMFEVSTSEKKTQNIKTEKESNFIKSKKRSNLLLKLQSIFHFSTVGSHFNILLCIFIFSTGICIFKCRWATGLHLFINHSCENKELMSTKKHVHSGANV